MATEFCEIQIVEDPLQISPIHGESEAGAIVDFFGVVRGLEEGAGIAGIFYEAHRDMALHQLRKIAAAARERYGCRQIALHHRVGWVPVAEPSLWLRVSAKHRHAAFEASEWIIEQLKEFVPIWKRPRYVEGGSHFPAAASSVPGVESAVTPVYHDDEGAAAADPSAPAPRGFVAR